MAEPVFAGELGEFLHALRWMQNSLLRFQEKSQVLWDVFLAAKETLIRIVGDAEDRSRMLKKRFYAKIRLADVGWSKIHSEAFLTIKSMLDETMFTSHLQTLDTNYTTNVFTDASKTHYAALLTQVFNFDSTKLIEEQNHEPLGTFNGEFTKVQRRWSVIEKEAYPLILALQEWREAFMASKGIRIYCDHDNIVKIFRPEAINSPSLSRTSIDKIYRWLYALVYVRMLCLEHLPGLRNKWADILSRWAHMTYYLAKDRRVTSLRLNLLRKRKAARLRGEHFVNVYLRLKAADPEFGLTVPSLLVIQVAQIACPPNNDELLSVVDKRKLIFDTTLNLWRYTRFGPFFIPSSSTELILRCLLTAHVSLAGHRTNVQTLDNLKHYVWWKEMKADVNGFVCECLVCERAQSFTSIPRPWGLTLKATKRFQILHFDYMYITDVSKTSTYPYKYLLVLKDDYSSFVELIPTISCDHEPVAEAIVKWISRYVCPVVLNSDMGSHFKNLVIEHLVTLLPTSQHFTVAYSPWSNGTVERANKEIKLCLQRLLRSKGIKFSEWPVLVPAVMVAVNRVPSSRLGGLSPLQVMNVTTDTENPFSKVFLPDNYNHIVITPDEILSSFSTAITLLQDIHCNVEQNDLRIDRNNRRKDKFKNKIDFCLGEFVMWAQVRKHVNKLLANWRGPYRVVGILSDWVVEIQHLVTQKIIVSHTSRIKFYADNLLDVSCELLDNISESERNVDDFFEVDQILDIRFDSVSKSYFVLLSWKGFSAAENHWEDLKIIFADVPDMILIYLEKCSSVFRDAVLQYLNHILDPAVA
jgi:hypothetical protein